MSYTLEYQLQTESFHSSVEDILVYPDVAQSHTRRRVVEEYLQKCNIFCLLVKMKPESLSIVCVVPKQKSPLHTGEGNKKGEVQAQKNPAGAGFEKFKQNEN